MKASPSPGSGYLAFDIGAPLRLPAVKTTLAERSLGEGDVTQLASRGDL